MPRYDARKANPARFERAKQEQKTIIESLTGRASVVRLCPFCNHKISVLFPGYHAQEITKCPNCGELAAFPAVRLKRI